MLILDFQMQYRYIHFCFQVVIEIQLQLSTVPVPIYRTDRKFNPSVLWIRIRVGFASF
jgi:hypothetical protein